MLVFEAHNLNVEWYTKVPVAIQNAIHCYYVIYDEKRKKKQNTSAITQTSLDHFYKRVDRIDSSKE